jgi:hypothetical protein
MKLDSQLFCRLALSITLGAAIATADTMPSIIHVPSPGNNGAAPVGIAVTPNELLFTQPFCAGNQVRGVYKADVMANTSSLFQAIPEAGVCAENYLTISTGLGGFTAGDTFVTGPSTTNPDDEEIFKNGSTPFVDLLAFTKRHAGITFDRSGTFDFALIATLRRVVIGFDSTGKVKFLYRVPNLLNPDYVLEGGTVAPLTYAACPGCLFVEGTLATNVNNDHPSGAGAIFLVTPGTPGTPPTGSPMTKVLDTPGPEPEALVFVPNNLSCTLGGFSFFVSGYAKGAQIDKQTATNGAILAYTPDQLKDFKGQFLVPDEGFVDHPGVISAFRFGPHTFSTFSTTSYELEQSSIIQCPSTGCPATFGFWKHHPFPASMFVNGFSSIGCRNYSAADLLDILNMSPSGGNAVIILAHQLIAAIANYDAGAKQTPEATAAIGAAIDLLCANNVNLSSAFVQASTSLGQQMTALADTLDVYNSSAPDCEGR